MLIQEGCGRAGEPSKFFARRWNLDYESAHAIIAYLFHVDPDKLMNMSQVELEYWLDRAKQANEFFNAKT
ncbi:MAG: GpE family phage tail protein [Oligoflexales bacterium]|nr:GpE family phage tail protein [Oligoflexales bacterium]